MEEPAPSRLDARGDAGPYSGLDGLRRSFTSAEREELSRVRRELRVVREERDVLAKAIAFFTKTTTR